MLCFIPAPDASVQASDTSDASVPAALGSKACVVSLAAWGFLCLAQAAPDVRRAIAADAHVNGLIEAISMCRYECRLFTSIS